MDRLQFDARADQLRASARQLQTTVEDCVARAAQHISGENPTGLAGASPSMTSASVALGHVCRAIEDMMTAYDRLQTAIGGAPRYTQVLEQLGDRPELGE